MRSSFHTTICVLEGLLELENARGATVAVTSARGPRPGVPAGAAHAPAAVVRRGDRSRWARFAFPTEWHYDVLRGLDYLRRAGVAPDARVDEAVGLVAERRQPDGRWLLDEAHRDAVSGDLEGGAGQPSRWNTLRALRVLRWHSGHARRTR